jgi:hypothetical protein
MIFESATYGGGRDVEHFRYVVDGNFFGRCHVGCPSN